MHPRPWLDDSDRGRRVTATGELGERRPDERRREDGQEAAGCQRRPRVGAESVADDEPGLEPEDRVAVDPDTDAGGAGDLVKPSGQAAFCRVVERGRSNRLARRAASTTEMPGRSRATRAASITAGSTPSSSRAASRASTAAPSIGTGPTWTTTSPTTAPALLMTAPSSTSPSIWPTTTGRVTAEVTSV